MANDHSAPGSFMDVPRVLKAGHPSPIQPCTRCIRHGCSCRGAGTALPIHEWVTPVWFTRTPKSQFALVPLAGRFPRSSFWAVTPDVCMSMLYAFQMCVWHAWIYVWHAIPCMTMPPNTLIHAQVHT